MVLASGGKLHLAPIGDDPKRILDVGTGTGIWAIEMGNDLSPIQPDMVPPNVHFEVDDVEERWMYNEPFDYIHSRTMAKSIADWPNLVRQCYKFTRPGGWVEFQDLDIRYYSKDGSLRTDHHIYRWVYDLIEASTLAGRDPCPGPKLEGWVREAGYQNVHHHKFILPVGPWPKDFTLKQVGAWNLMQIDEGLEAFSLRLFTRIFGWSISDIHVMLAHARNDLRDKSIHAQFDLLVLPFPIPLGRFPSPRSVNEGLLMGVFSHVVYAQKPDTGRSSGGRPGNDGNSA
ncbi:hypothetical protein GP486_000432 [Trichoglossum hirsutum]|uniref:S-adenosyl-L-methionine-dependent methyltransferase n=1 Tax=Trichoglossum hirsutum TaxID=265104 RepID=A0A9P8LJ05_9PEZI|nr:hypothetical protein GP486_000432 [Trichoglossum hirsutum]